MQRQRFQIDLLHYVMMPQPLQGEVIHLPNFQRSSSLIHYCLTLWQIQIELEDSLQRMRLLMLQLVQK